MYQKKSFYHKPTEENLSPRAYSLLQNLFGMVLEAGLSVREVRMVYSLLRAKVEETIKNCSFGGSEER